MPASIAELVRRWKNEDGEYDYHERDNHDYRRHNSRIPNLSLHSLETVITELFGSCSVNIQNFFDSASPRSSSYTPQRTSVSTNSNSTSPTAKSSTQTPTREDLEKKAIRSKSVEYSRRKKTRNLEHQRRYRSMSRFDRMTTIEPARKIMEETEISFTHQEDDVSVITSRTLNELCIETEESRRLAAEQQEMLRKAAEQLDMRRIAAERIEAEKEEQRRIAMEQHNYIDEEEEDSILSSEEENEIEEIMEDATHISAKSSGTTEFESIWRTKSNLSSNRNADNNHFAMVNASGTKSGIYRQKQGNLQHISRAHFSTIDENTLYINEQEI